MSHGLDEGLIARASSLRYQVLLNLLALAGLNDIWEPVVTIRPLTLLRLSAALAFLLSSAGTAVANDYEAGNPIRDQFRIDLGGYAPVTSTTVRVDGIIGGVRVPGTSFDVERDLGYQSKKLFRADGYWRFFGRHKLIVSYFDSNRDASKSINETLQFGNLRFPVGVGVNSQFATRLLQAAYEWDFLQGEHYFLGANIGVHEVKFDLTLSGTAYANTSATTISGSKDASVTGPLPVVGLHGLWRFNPKFYIDGQYQYFQASISPYSGHVSDWTFSAVWQAFKYVGFGVGYDAFVTGLTVDSSRFNGDLRWSYEGVRVFLTGSF